ncbi:CD3324 family protein [Bacillus sp. SM2101]
MKYINANHVLPDQLILEIQKYVQGQVVYIPNTEGVRKKWGENSGNREYLNCRN